ncbi:MAG TPA: aldo/keto reductase [Anaerolineales bacterium]|nr:aldo/keto reductase [Anaerolineales bacterium]
MENPAADRSADHVPLGKSGILLSPLGLGAWSWGDRFVWGYGRNYVESDVAQAFQTSREAGINWVDTAEFYGLGQSERLVGRFMGELNADAPRMVVATKFFPLPWKWYAGALVRSLKGSLQRLQFAQVDLYQVHFPRPDGMVERFAQGLVQVLEQGLARAVGVSNYNADQMLRTQIVLNKHGLMLASNQLHYSLLDRKIEKIGLLEVCQKLEISVIAYSPLEMGLLTGKYTPANPPPGSRGQRYSRRLLAEMQPLVQALGDLGEQYGGKTPAQVALNWVMCKGALPIPGAKNARQAAENAGAMGWKLEPNAIKQLDELSDRVLARSEGTA